MKTIDWAHTSASIWRLRKEALHPVRHTDLIRMERGSKSRRNSKQFYLAYHQGASE